MIVTALFVLAIFFLILVIPCVAERNIGSVLFCILVAVICYQGAVALNEKSEPRTHCKTCGQPLKYKGD